MDSEEAVIKFIDSADDWVSVSDAYQMLLEEIGDDLLDRLICLTKHSSPEVRAVAVSLLAARRPHNPDIIDVIEPLLDDPDHLVRVRVLDSLSEYGELAEPLVPAVHRIVEEEKTSSDQLPRMLAISFLVSIAQQSCDYLIDEVLGVLKQEKGDMAEFVALQTLITWGKMEGAE